MPKKTTQRGVADMLMKWLINKLFPSDQIEESPHDTEKVLDEAKQVAKEARLTIQIHSEATEAVKKEIEKNGFAKFLTYDKDHKNRKEHEGE